MMMQLLYAQAAERCCVELVCADWGCWHAHLVVGSGLFVSSSGSYVAAAWHSCCLFGFLAPLAAMHNAVASQRLAPELRRLFFVGE
jgi:hypothetical protein